MGLPSKLDDALIMFYICSHDRAAVIYVTKQARDDRFAGTGRRYF